MHFIHTISGLSLVASSMASAIPRQALAPTSTVYQLQQNNTQFENLYTRKDGSILATRVDVPEIWVIEPSERKGTQLLTIPSDVTSVLGIVELHPDVFAVNTGNVTDEGIIAGSFQVWKVDLRGHKTETSLIAKIPEAGLLNGLAALNSDIILSADSRPGLIWRVDVNSGRYFIAIEDPALELPANSTSPAGINGLRISGDYAYFTNTAQQLFGRVRIDSEGTAAGPVERIAGGFAMDDFTILPDGTAYLVTSNQNTINRVSPDGTVTTVAGMADSLALGGGTSCQFGKTPEDRDILYVSTSGDRSSPINGTLMGPALVAAVDLSGFRRRY